MHWFKAVDHYSLHTPFVFQFYKEIVRDERQFYAFAEIEALRGKLLNDNRTIAAHDLGTGSGNKKNNLRKVSSIAKNALSNSKFSSLLFKMILRFRPRSVLELGTSLGINTAYLAKADSNIPVVTMEGCPETIAIARKSFEEAAIKNVKIVSGNIDETLPKLLQEIETVDFIYFDANHSKAATLNYFNLCLSKINKNSIFVFDDIHLSREMHEAWETIYHHPMVTVSLDIFDAGIVFFNKGLKKQHFVLEYYSL